MMYTGYFGFKQIPFDTKLDPRDFFYGASARANERSLIKALRDRYAASFLLGEQGIGKSALLRRLSVTLGGTHQFLFPGREGTRIEAIIDCLLEAFGLESEARSRAQKIELLRERITGDETIPDHLVLVVDDAHELSSSSMATLLELISEGGGDVLPFQLLFAGLPDLKGRKDESWAQRIGQLKICWTHLKGLSADEVRAFVAQRIELAGYRGSPLFSEQAMQSVIDYSDGNIGKLSVLCGFSLLSASLENLKVVTEAIVKEQAAHCLLKIHPETPGLRLPERKEEQKVSPPDPSLDRLIPTDLSRRYRELGIPKPETYAEGRNTTGLFRFVGACLRGRIGRVPAAIRFRALGIAAFMLISCVVFFGFSGARGFGMQPYSSVAVAPVSTAVKTFGEPHIAGDRGGQMEIAGSASDLTIQAMLSKAKAQIAAHRLFAPKGDNALETYQEIAKLVDLQMDTLHDLVQIKQQYQRWGNEAEIRKDWTNAAKFYNKAFSLAPHDEELTAAIERVRKEQVRADASTIETQNRSTREEEFEAGGLRRIGREIRFERTEIPRRSRFRT